jgi:cell division transport system permease protein
MYSLFSSLGNLLDHWVGTVMTVLVLGIAMVLPIGLHVTLDNLRGIDLQAEEWGSVTVFLRTSVTEKQANELTAMIDSRADASASPFHQSKAWKSSAHLLVEQALDVLDSNPLPGFLVGEAKSEQELTQVIDGLSSWLADQPAVHLRSTGLQVVAAACRPAGTW